MVAPKVISADQHKQLLDTLKNRFEKNMNRHYGIDWEFVQQKLKNDASPGKLWSLNEMEITGGEPDVIACDSQSNELTFFDCSIETPSGRRSLCYDNEGLQSRKEFKPDNSAVEMAAAIGIELLTVEQYRTLQTLGNFDTKTSSWVKTPAEIRQLGGALFCDRRYNHVFVYHNGASSYYAVRGFRGLLRI